MSLNKAKILPWLPRILAISFTVFISLFAFDVFDQPRWLLALLIHLIPTYLLTAVTALAWKKPKLGGLLFILAGFALLAVSRFEYPAIFLPPLVIGLLFLAQRNRPSRPLSLFAAFVSLW